MKCELNSAESYGFVNFDFMSWSPLASPPFFKGGSRGFMVTLPEKIPLGLRKGEAKCPDIFKSLFQT